jgi:hypothetical protein
MPTVPLTPELAEYLREAGIDLTTGKPIVPQEAPGPATDISETEFQAAVIQEAKERGWRHYHTFDSRRSAEGFPDLILLRKHRAIVAELKSTKGKVSTAQKNWINAFRQFGWIEVFVWRPADWPQIKENLK